MHSYKCPIQDGDDPFYTFFLPLVIFPKMKHHFRGRRAILEGDVQPLCRQEFYSIVQQSALLDRHIIHDLKLVLA